MRRARYFFLGLLLAVAGGAFAVTQGGFPFFPRFGGVTITAPTASFNQLALNTLGSTSSNYLSFSNNGALKALILNERVAGGNCGLSAVDDLCIRASAGAVRISTDNGASSSRVLRQAIAGLSVSSSSCAVTAQIGFAATCARSGTGSFNVAFSPVFTSTVICTATVGAGAGGTPTISSLNAPTSGLSFVTLNPAGTVADPASAINVSLSCSGF